MFKSPLFSDDPYVCTQTFKLLTFSDAVADLTTTTAATATQTAATPRIARSRLR
jgi:hypothetical protein